MPLVANVALNLHAKPRWAHGFGLARTKLPEHHHHVLKAGSAPRCACSVPVGLGGDFESSKRERKEGVTLSIFCQGQVLSPLLPALLQGVPRNTFEIDATRRGCSVMFCLNSLQ